MFESESALRAIAAPTRRNILRLVRQDEMSAGEIAAHFDITQPAISQHLRILKQTNLVTERREGTKRFYRANFESLAALRDYLGWMWEQGLDGLKRAVEEQAKR